MTHVLGVLPNHVNQHFTNWSRFALSEVSKVFDACKDTTRWDRTRKANMSR